MSVRTFVIPFYYVSRSAKVLNINYGSGSNTAESYGSGSATLLLVCQSLAVPATEPDALWQEHGGSVPGMSSMCILFLDGIHPPEI